MADDAGRPLDRGAASRAILALWKREGKWADVALEGVSMDPIIRDGATLRVRFGEANPQDLRVGDVVLYTGGEKLIAHRIVRVIRRGPQAGRVRIKGDPLTTRRAVWISASDILGRVTAVTQPDGSRRYLNTPAGRLLSRSAALVSTTVGAVEARLPRRAVDRVRRRAHRSLTGRALGLLTSTHDALHQRLETERGRLLTPEARFLVEACRPMREEGSLARIRAAASEIVDWELVREQAVSLGLAPLVNRSIVDAGEAGLSIRFPPGFQSALSRSAAAGIYLALQRRAELVRVLDALARCGIEPVLLKGAALAALVYEQPELRTMNDLDLLVREDEIETATQALAALSYGEFFRATHADPRVRAAFYARHHHATPLIDAKRRTVVELHRNIASLRGGPALDIERLRSRSVPAFVEGRAARAFSPADLLLHTCLHMSYADRFVGKLRDLVDLHAIILRYGEAIDWNSLLVQARSDATARCLYACLDLAHRLFGTPIPGDFLQEIRRASRLDFVGARLLRALACAVLFEPASSGRTILSTASAKWCCDALLRQAGWPGRLKALAVLLAEE